MSGNKWEVVIAASTKAEAESFLDILHAQSWGFMGTAYVRRNARLEGVRLGLEAAASLIRPATTKVDVADMASLIRSLDAEAIAAKEEEPNR